MIIAGNCLCTDENNITDVYRTAELLGIIPKVTHFRCKIWGGGTTPDRYKSGIGYAGVEMLQEINDSILPTGTEFQSTSQMLKACKLDFLWIGARNSQNYDLLEFGSYYQNDLFIKRGTGMTIDEVIGLYDIMLKMHDKEVYIIDRGINTFDRKLDSRWSPDIKGSIRLQTERPDIFDNLVIDCSHSVGKKQYIANTYKAFKSIGIKHFMFECTWDGKSETDSQQMLSVSELNRIIN
ncbi:MAG: hypothetical protein GY853_06640 [PVC group bacterium]|nr:hypothetical protein [PVC group bacterium]